MQTSCLRCMSHVIRLKTEAAVSIWQAKKARQAAVARRDMSFRNADRMMKLVRSRCAFSSRPYYRDAPGPGELMHGVSLPKLPEGI